MIRYAIILLCISVNTMFAQGVSRCDSLRIYFERQRENKASLIQYDKALALIGGDEQLYMPVLDSVVQGKVLVWIVVDQAG